MGDDSSGGGESGDLVVQTVVGAVVGGASLIGPDVGAAASALAPAMAVGLDRLSGVLRARRHAHAEETLTDAVKTAALPASEFIERALLDDAHSELLVRALTAAQDTALREKRRALGRALADGVCGESTVDDELLFIRAIEDLDAPHIAVLRIISLEPPNRMPLPRAWQHNDILERVPELSNALRAILATLDLHTLISNGVLSSGYGYSNVDLYRIEHPGRVLLSRLSEDAD